MIALLLTLLAGPSVPQEYVGPARLHPHSTLVYAETPDVSDILVAYEQAPVAQMFKDPTLRTAVAELMATVEYDIGSMIGDFANQNNIPPTLLAAPLATLTRYLEGVDTASFSISLEEAEAGEFESVLLQMLETAKNLGTVSSGLATFADENNGAFPPNLESLALEEQVRLDGWGAAFEYRVHAGGAGYELRSLGADGQFGGRGADTDMDSPRSLEGALGEEALARVGATLVVEFTSTGEAGQAHGMLQALIAQTPMRPMANRPGDRDNGQPLEGELSTYNLGAIPGLQVWVLLHEARLVLGFGSSGPEAFQDRLAGAVPSAQSSASYARLLELYPAGEGATITRGFLAVDGLARAAKKIQAAFGVDKDWNMMAGSISSSMWRMELNGERFITDFYTGLPDPSNELAQCVGYTPMSDSLWSAVPADSIMVASTTIDASLLHRQIMGSLSASGWQGQAPSALTEMEERYGFNLETDVFGSVGSGAVFYMLPVTGMMSVPGMAVVLELEDPESFRKGLEGLLALLGDQSGGEFEIKFRPYRDHPMWYFTFSQVSGSPIQISPSLVIFQDRLIVTLTSLRAKKEIKRLSLEPGELHRLFTGELPEGATAAGYMDWASLTDGVYTAAQALASLAGGSVELPFDLAALPESETFTHFFEPTIAWTTRDENGIHSRVESSFGPATMGTLAGLGVAGSLLAQNAFGSPGSQRSPGRAQTAPGPTQVVVIEHEEHQSPPESLEPERPKPGSTKDTLSFLSTRLAIYKLEKARYPTLLGELVNPTENYPRGFLGSESLPVDEWGQGFSYSVSDAGTEYQLWSLGADGVDQEGGGDDLVVQ